MKASPMHAALTPLPSPALSSDGVESYRLACGGVSTRVDIRDDSDLITCKRCRRALADALPVISPYDNIIKSIENAQAAARVSVDLDVDYARKALLAQYAETRRLLMSAVEDLDRETARMEQLTIEGYGALDRAMVVARIPAFIASNIRIDSLARYGAELDKEIARAVRGEDGWRGEALRAQVAKTLDGAQGR